MNCKSITKWLLSGWLTFFFCESLVLGSYPFLENVRHSPFCIESVLVRHYTAFDFMRIAEFFTGREHTGGDTILRVDELCRAGIYLVVELNKAVCELPEDAEVVFQYILSDCHEVKKKNFELKSKGGPSHWLFVGVTGLEYQGVCQTFLAWSLEIYAGGQCVTQHSYLWKMDEEEANCNECE